MGAILSLDVPTEIAAGDPLVVLPYRELTLQVVGAGTFELDLEVSLDRTNWIVAEAGITSAGVVSLSPTAKVAYVRCNLLDATDPPTITAAVGYS